MPKHSSSRGNGVNEETWSCWSGEWRAHAGLSWESSEAMDVQIVDFDYKISRIVNQRIVLQHVGLSLMSRNECSGDNCPSNWSLNGSKESGLEEDSGASSSHKTTCPQPQRPHGFMYGCETSMVCLSSYHDCVYPYVAGPQTRSAIRDAPSIHEIRRLLMYHRWQPIRVRIRMCRICCFQKTNRVHQNRSQAIEFHRT
jgi:hypothetical protein